MRNLSVLLAVAMLMLLMTSCIAGPNEMVNTADSEGDVAGFWQGLWNGFISPVTFAISLFSETVNVYEVHNNGGWYDFGFLLGASIILGGSGGGAARRRR